MRTDYSNYDPISWSLGTPITAGRLQQVSTNISEVKSATDDYAKGVLVFNQFITAISSITNGVLHTGLAGDVYTIANLNEDSGPSSGNQEITLEGKSKYLFTHDIQVRMR